MGRPQASVILLATVATLALAQAAPGESRQEVDERLVLELRSLNPAAADTFTLANLARESRRHEEAALLFGRVAETVPGFSHARRRQAYELMAMDRRVDAILGMRAALEIEESAWNLLGLAMALGTPTAHSEPSAEDLREATRFVRLAARMDSKDSDVAFFACRLALETGDYVLFGDEVKRFEMLDPGNPWARYFRAIDFAANGDMGAARGRIDTARSLGLPEIVYRDFLDRLERSRSPLSKVTGVGGYVLGGWVAGLLGLLAAGSLLSRVAVQASRRVPSEESGRATGLDARLRKTYQWILWASCAYYYVSIPLVIATVVAVGGGLVYLMLMARHIPLKLLAFVALLTLVTLWAILKSLFVRGRDEDPGLRVGPGEYPRLRHVLDRVAARIGTRPVTNVYVTPGCEIAVMERGGVFRQLSGHAERCLILGIGALEGMRMRPFRAVLAHEYGHFSNRDTAGGGFALAVRRSLVITAVHLAHGGAAAWYNPAWLFVNGFYRLFLLVSEGASRLQEVLADRWAAFSYGSAAFNEGLRHVIDRSIRFDAHVNAVLHEVIDEKRTLSNLYAYRPSASLVDESKLSEALEEAVNRKPSAYDSHPCPTDRFAWVDKLGAQGGPEEPNDRDEAWTLFDQREELERRLTDQVRRNVEMGHGIMIPAEETAR